MTALALLAVLLVPQANDAATEWGRLNRVELVVNDDVITLRQLVRQLVRAQEQRPVTTAEELTALRTLIGRNAIDELLLRQAGVDLGQPKEAIDRLLGQLWERQIELSGGHHEFALKLAEEEVSSLEQRQELADDIHTYTYLGIVTGAKPGKEGRHVRDRYVRPGERLRGYESMRRTGRELHLIGGRSITFVFQELLLVPDEDNDLKARRALAEDLRRRAEEGEDFTLLVNQHGLRKAAQGVLPDVSLDELPLELAEFALGAAEGDLSPVLPVRDRRRDRVEGWRIVRVLEQHPPEVPEFSDQEVQFRLQRAWQNRLDELRRSQAVNELRRSAYVWLAE